jgi:hypothetical protein
MAPPETDPSPPSFPTRIENRLLSNRAQIASAIFSAFTALAAVLAMVSFFQATSAQKQHDAEEAIARLYPMDVNVNLPLGAHPNVRAALNDDPDGKVFNKLTSPEKTLFKAACDAIGDEFEYYLLIRDHIRSHPQGKDIVKAWVGYLHRTWRRSYGLRDDINADREIWTEAFLNEFEHSTSGLKPALVASSR